MILFLNIESNIKKYSGKYSSFDICSINKVIPHQNITVLYLITIKNH